MSEFTPNISNNTGGLGILITNLGTPDVPTSSGVRRYLAQFLRDPRVVELPAIIWWPILYGIILPIRPARSAHAYRKIWTANGSPLLTITQNQTTALQKNLRTHLRDNFHIVFGMRYGNPAISTALQQLQHAGITRLLILPLYPQYSGATTGATFDAIAGELSRWRVIPELRLIRDYHAYPAYLDALADQIRTTWQETFRPERLLFSFHGLPQRVINYGDPYFNQCNLTAQGVAERLKLSANDWIVSFQSRFGRQEWIKPYTDATLKNWAGAGIKSVDVICPGFAADCLETLEEIAIQNRDLFLHAGGQHYRYLPALNDSPRHIDALTDLIVRNLRGWPEEKTE